MQAVKEKLKDLNAARKAKAEARAEEKVLEHCIVNAHNAGLGGNKGTIQKKTLKLRHCLNHYRQFSTPLVSLQCCRKFRKICLILYYIDDLARHFYPSLLFLVKRLIK